MKMTILDHLRLDHAYLHTLLDRACDASADDRDGALAVLLDALVRHETAEAALVRPRTREIDGGHAVAARLDDQERAISHVDLEPVAEVQGEVAADSPPRSFARARAVVRASLTT